MAPKKKHNSGDHKMDDDPEVNAYFFTLRTLYHSQVAAEREYAIANGIVKPMVESFMF